MPDGTMLALMRIQMTDYVKITILTGDGYHDEKTISAKDFKTLAEWLNKKAPSSASHWRVNGLFVKANLIRVDNVDTLIQQLCDASTDEDSNVK